MEQRLCAYCGNRILSIRNARTRFCSVKCRVASHRNPLPQEMREVRRWMNHSEKKVPLNPETGLAASSTNPSTWTDYRTAKDASPRLGFVLGENFACIDLDHCLDSQGQPNDATTELLSHYPHNYIEVSPSGTGLHIWGIAEERPGFRRIWKGQTIEFYSQSRYITITGNVYQHGTLQPL